MSLSQVPPALIGFVNLARSVPGASMKYRLVIELRIHGAQTAAHALKDSSFLRLVVRVPTLNVMLAEHAAGLSLKLPLAEPERIVFASLAALVICCLTSGNLAVQQATQYAAALLNVPVTRSK